MAVPSRQRALSVNIEVVSKISEGRKGYVPPHCPHTVPTETNVEHLHPETVFNLLMRSECVLVDLRSEDRAAGLIEGAVNVPAIDASKPFLAKIPEMLSAFADQPLVVFTCQYSAHRAPQCSNWYRQQANPRQRVAILSGGFRGWEALGLPVQSLASGDNAQSMDQLAMRLGTQFVHRLPQRQLPMTNVQPAQQAQRPSQSSGTPVRVTLQSVAQTKQKETVSQTQPISQSSIPYVPPVLPNTVPTIDGVENVAPDVVHQLIQSQQCVLVDLRGEDRAAGLIEGSVHVQAIDNVPFTWKVPDLVRQWEDQPLVIFTCQYSAHRAPQCANWYREKSDSRQRVAIMTGGFRCWEGVGLPVQSLADHETAMASDAAALQLGTQFVQTLPERQAQRIAGSEAQPIIEPAVQPKMQVVDTSNVTVLHVVPQTSSTLVAQPLTNVTTTLQNNENISPQLPGQTVKDPLLSNECERFDPATLHELMMAPEWGNCVLVDLRGEDRAAGLIEGAVNVPAIDTVPFPVKVPNLVQEWEGRSLVVFTCQYSRHRAPQCANWYKEQAGMKQRVGVLEGGFRGWEALGLPVQALATGDTAQIANDLAMQLGTQFVNGIPTGVSY